MRPQSGTGQAIRTCLVRGSPRYIVETYTDGKRTRQFFRVLVDAQKAHADIEKQKLEMGKGWDALRPSEKQALMATVYNIHAAGQTLSGVWEKFKAMPTGTTANCTLGRAVKELLAEKEKSNRRPKTIAMLKWYLELFIRGREGADIAAIGETEIAQWFESRNESPIARRGHTGILSSLFQFAWRKRYVAENPVRRIERVHLDRKIPCVLTLPQVRKVLAWTKRERPKWLGWLALALFAGMRPDAEADLITWTDIDLKRGRIVITKSKIRAPRIVDLAFCPPALHWLRLAKRLKAPLGLSYPKRRDYVRKLRKVLGFKRWPQDVLRHTAASNLLAYHQDAGKVAAFLGNSAGVLLRDYKALIFKEDAEKWMKLT